MNRSRWTIQTLEGVNLRQTKIGKQGKADRKKSRPKLVFIGE